MLWQQQPAGSSNQRAAAVNISNGDIGKVPLALQQLALAKQRSIMDGDMKLADMIEKKMKEIIDVI